VAAAAWRRFASQSSCSAFVRAGWSGKSQEEEEAIRPATTQVHVLGDDQVGSRYSQGAFFIYLIYENFVAVRGV